MTLKEVLETTIALLSNISVPVVFIQQIGEPITGAINNLTACVEALNGGVKDDGNPDSD